MDQTGTINLQSNSWLQLKITSHYFVKTNQDVSEPCFFMVAFMLTVHNKSSLLLGCTHTTIL